MKRIISFLLILALLICLVACGNDEESSSSESQAEQSSTETQSESMESESVTESETQSNTSSESATESESQSQSTESVTESESQGQSTETATESEQESETNTESEQESETNSESESESTTESETESEIESESSTETESETESESDSESQNPTTVAEWVEANSNEINTFMNANYLTAFGKKAMSLAFKQSAIAEGQWIFEGEEKIEAIKLVFKYNKSSESEYIYVVTYKLNEPIEMSTFLNSPITIDSSKMESYVFNYNPTIQGTRDDLVNALFKAVGVNEVGGPRYFKDHGQGAGISGLGMANGFTFVEVGENEVKEYTIYVNVASDDTGYVNKLNNPSEYKIFSSKTIDISGASVEYVAQ